MRLWGARSRFYGVYGLAHAGKSLFLVVSELYFAFYLTEVCGLSAGVMGLILGGAMAVSALTDLPIGAILRRHVRTAQAAGLTQMVATVVCASGFCGFALVGLAHPGAARIALAVAALAVFRLSYSVLDIPQNALMAFMSTSDRERAELASVRYVFSSAVNIAVALAFLPLFKLGAHRAAAHFGVFLLAIGLVAVLSSIVLWREVGRRGESTPASPPAARIDPPPLSVLRVAALLFLVSGAASVFGRLEPYFAAYALPGAVQGEAFLTYGAVGTLLSQPVWLWVARRAGLAAAFGLGCVVLMAAGFCFGLLALGGPDLSFGGAVLFGVGCGGVMLALWAFAAAAAEHNGQAAMTFAAITCVSKLALAAAAFAAALVLAHAGYRSRSGALSLLLPILVATPMLGGLAALGVMALPRRLANGPLRAAGVTPRG